MKDKKKIYRVETHREAEPALLVGVVLPGMTRSQEKESLDELAFLARTAGARVVETLLQDRHVISPATLIGKGLVHQIVRMVPDKNIKLVIFDTDLTPVQMKNLEKEFNRKVLDRSALILDIFARRARTREAQTQVELAQLQYFLPRLTRLWTHLSRQEAGIGTRGPGETQLEVDRRAVRKRIGHLKHELEKIEKQRQVRRKNRRDIRKVALVGYTNVGKSSLLNALTDADVFVENRLFATLDATIRSLTLDELGKIVLIDTVGFIRKLPHHLVASFRSTLEETVQADLLLHIIDVNHPQFEEQIGSVQEVLRDLKIDAKPILHVFNKVDLLSNRNMLADLKQRFPNSVFTSAVKGIGLNALLREIIRLFKEEEIERKVYLSSSETKIIAAIHEIGHVVDKVYENGMAIIQYRALPENASRIDSLLKELKGD